MDNSDITFRRALPASGIAGKVYEEPGRFSSGISIIEQYLQAARTSKLLIGAILAGALVIGLLVSLLSTPKYRATSRIEISQVRDNVTNVQGVTVADRQRDRMYLPTQYQLLHTRSLANRVVRQLNLTEDKPFLSAFGIKGASGGESGGHLSTILMDNVVIDPIEGSSLVDISFISPNPQLSARIANTWAQQFIAANLDRRFGATIEARRFLEQRLAQTRKRLEDAERQLIDYASSRGLLTVGPDNSGNQDSETTAAQTLVASDLQDLNKALAQATTDRIKAESAMDARAMPVDDPNTSTVAQLQQQRSTLSAQLAQLRSNFGPDYPQVRAAQAQIDQLDKEIRHEEGLVQKSNDASYQEALNREQRLTAAVDKLRKQFISQRKDSVQYNILQREVDTNRELYAGLLQRYREIGVAGVGENNISVVDTARVPRIPFEPRIVRNMVVSFLIGLIAALLVLILREQLNQSPRDPQQVQERLGLPLLAGIPRSPDENHVEDITSSYTDLYEAYFSLTSSLAFRNGGTIPRSLMVTSTRPGEGKSLSAVALAYLIGRQGKRVLLIDADMRNSGMSKYVRPATSSGLSQYLQGNDDWRSLIASPEPLSGFDLMGPGRRSPAVAEMLSNGRFQMLLDQVEAAYDHVVIDGPPVLGLADAPLIAASLEAVLMVVEANTGKWRYIESAIRRLEQAHANILGAIVTKLDDRNASYGYGKGYGYGYGYGPDGRRQDEEETMA